ncbi:hypothetical protein IQ07DRAFT_641055 [Pyrenochaeta sp. DS3sAY3a]|nr:hypothetical protein IQ07DRAFT_641055 [Pyrenochaeta sp. DS3sAY3a]
MDNQLDQSMSLIEWFNAQPEHRQLTPIFDDEGVYYRASQPYPVNPCLIDIMGQGLGDCEAEQASRLQDVSQPSMQDAFQTFTQEGNVNVSTAPFLHDAFLHDPFTDIDRTTSLACPSGMTTYHQPPSTYRNAPTLNASASTAPSPPPESSNEDFVVIGIILSNGSIRTDRYKCHELDCAASSFGRLADLKRHNASKHHRNSANRQSFWCPVEGCKRSRNGGGEPFPRKDKMKDHLRCVHRGSGVGGR